MRKLSITLMIMAAAISISWLNSCCRDKEHTEEAINMGVSEKGTRAVVDNKASLISQAISSGTGFGVYGYKSVNQTPTLLFDNFEVHPSSNAEDPDWTYTPIRYWDKNPQASYQFIAYWPHVGQTSVNGAPYTTVQDYELTIHDIPFWQDASLAASADFMTATRKGNYSSGDFTDENTGVTRVRFTFSHILAKFVIRAYYVGIEQNSVAVSGLRLTKGQGQNNYILQSDGKASYSETFGATLSSSFSGNTPTGTGNHILFNPANAITLPTSTFDDETEESTHGYQEICAWLMVPCSGWTNLGLAIDCSIAGAAPVTYNVYELSLNTTIDNVVHNGQTYSGRSYIVTLKFDSSGGGVELQSVLVREWEEQEISTSVHNW